MNRQTMIRRDCMLAVFAAALAGCAFAPLSNPRAPTSSGRYAAEAAPDTTVQAAGTAQHFDAGAQPVPQWWQLYGSDTLDSWVEEGLRNNPSLDAVRHTLEAAHQQFRAQVGGTTLPSIDAGGQVSRQRALGLPERSLRMASYALAGVIGALAGFAGGEMLLAFFGNAPLLTFYGFVPVALGGMGNNRGSVVGGLLLGLFQQTANFLVGGIFASVAVFTVFIIVLLARPEGLAGAALQRRV